MWKDLYLVHYSVCDRNNAEVARDIVEETFCRTAGEVYLLKEAVPNLFPRLVNLRITRQNGHFKVVIVSLHPPESLLCLYCTSVDLPSGPTGCLTLIFKVDLPLSPD